MSDYIILGLNIFLGVLIFFGVFWGLIRGLKKTTIRLFFLLATCIILIFVTAPITKLLLKIPLDTTITINETTITGKMSLLKWLTSAIEAFLGKDFVTKYPEFTDLIVGLPLILVNAIIYVVFFWLFKLLLLPINALISKLILRPKKRKEAVGFASMNDKEPEYPNSDEAITPLMEVYRNSEEQEEAQIGVFIKNDNEIGKENPSGRAIPVVATQVEEPETKSEIKKREKEERRARKRENALSKPRKYRLLGGIVGIFVGIITTFNTMIPVYGIIDLLKEHNNTEFKNITDKTISLSTITDGLSTEIIKGYELSILGRLSSFTGIEQLGLNGFDNLTSYKVNDKKIVLRSDVKNLVTTAQKTDILLGQLKDINNKGLQNITQPELDTVITSAQTIIGDLSQINLLSASSEFILPIAYEFLAQNNIKFVENEYTNELILSTIKTLAEEADINIFEELSAIIDVAKYLNDQKILIKVVTNNYDGIIPLINNLDEDFEDTLTTKLFAIKTVDTTIPNLLNIGLQFFDNAVHFGYVENTATKQELKTSICSLINNFIATGRTLSEESKIYVTDNTLIPLGNLLDTFRNSKLFNIETYNNLLDYTISQVKTVTNSAIPERFINVFNNQLLRNMSSVENWTNEMTIIKEAMDIIRDKDSGFLGEVVEDKDLRTGYSVNFTVKESTFINIGKAFDTLEESILLGTRANTTIDSTHYENTTFTNLFACMLEELYSQMSGDDETMNEILSITDLMKENLIKNQHIISSDSSFWEDEMTAISPLIIEIYNISENEEFEITAELGTSLDKASHKVILGGNSTLKLMDKIVNIVKDSILGEDYIPTGSDKLNDEIYNLMQGISTNLNNPDTTTKLQNNQHFWEEEIEYFMALKRIADKAETITTISEANTISYDLDQIYLSEIIPETNLNNTIATILKQLKTSDTTGVAGEINTLIDEIATDITSENFFESIDSTDFWQIELAHITELNDIKFENEAGYNVIDNLPSIGAKLDDITQGNSDKRASYLITENRIRKLLSTAIFDMTDSITNSFPAGEIKTSIELAVTDITTNLYNPSEDDQIEIRSFEEEFGYLKALSNLEINSSYFEYTADISTLETKLRTLGSNLDAIAFNTKTEDSITSYDNTRNSQIITRTILNNIISSAFSSAKIENPTKTIETAFNQLISDIQANIEDISNKDQVIKYSRELSYVSTLIQLNNPDSDITLDNVTTTVTKYLDKIAFNSKESNFADINYNASHQIIGEYAVSYTESETTKYYNSVIITREILKTLMSTILDDFKAKDNTLTDEQVISNLLIDNLTDKINTTSPLTDAKVKYNNYTDAFTALNEVKSEMESQASYVDGKTYNTLSEVDLENIDKMLTNFQDNPISGVVITRKIAIMILHKIEDMLIVGGQNLTFAELTNLIAYYEANDNTESENYLIKEVYYCLDSSAQYANPFVSLYSKLSQITA